MVATLFNQYNAFSAALCRWFLFGLAYFVVGLWWIFISLHDIGGMNAALSVAAVVLLSAYMALFLA